MYICVFICQCILIIWRLCALFWCDFQLRMLTSFFEGKKSRCHFSHFLTPSADSLSLLTLENCWCGVRTSRAYTRKPLSISVIPEILLSLAMYGTWVNKKKTAEASPPFRYCVAKGDTLSSIAAKTKQSEKTIKELNPLIFCGKNTTVYPGQELIVDEALAVSLPPPPEFIDYGWGQMHVVRAGDTVKSVAEEYNTTEKAIRSDNRQYFPHGERGIMFPGQMLHIRIINTIIPDLNNNHRVDPCTKIHIVTKSDSFESICDMYNITQARLLLQNKVTFPVGMKPRLVPGQELIVGRHAPDPIDDENHHHDLDHPHHYMRRHIAEVELTKQIHVVVDGETPESIAEMYGMTMAEMREYNRAYFPRGYRGQILPHYKLVVKRRNTKRMPSPRSSLRLSLPEGNDDEVAAQGHHHSHGNNGRENGIMISSSSSSSSSSSWRTQQEKRWRDKYPIHDNKYDGRDDDDNEDNDLRDVYGGSTSSTNSSDDNDDDAK
jgi:LysM repeat protein